jgi:hypothetical protein
MEAKWLQAIDFASTTYTVDIRASQKRLRAVATRSSNGHFASTIKKIRRQKAAQFVHIRLFSLVFRYLLFFLFL